MALARNLNPKRSGPKIKIPNLKNKFWIGIVLVSIGILVFGFLNLWPHLRIGSTKKEEIKFETGDRPLPETVSIWVTAEDGLVMRENPDINSKQLYLVPNGTQLSSSELIDEWYKVSYMDKTGWVNKNYVTTEAPAQDATKNWKNYQNTSEGYTVRYPSDWVVQDYGDNPATNSESYVAFGPQLPAELDTSSLPPILIRTVESTASQIENSYKGYQKVAFKPYKISGLAGEKVVYNSNSGTQMTAYFVSKGTTVYIIEETGGYSAELSKMVASLNLP